MKNPTIATLLNIVPGLGYLYIGGKKKVFGILLIAALIASIVSSFDPVFAEFMDPAQEPDMTVWMVASLLSFVLVIAAFMYDAYTSAIASSSSSSKKKK